jgi:helicase required for RNAi-mediated heterochromatin assembly 1
MSRFPLSEHICDLKKDIDCPEYVKMDPQMKLFSDEYINILTEWPSEPQNDLDESQWEALRQILTKRLAIIQGPPGTGKTHVSVAALRLLLSARKADDPPIVIGAHTNHALDQLLNHISAWEPDYIRLGGRSLSENVKKRTLFEVSQSSSAPRLAGSALGPAYGKIHAMRKKIIETLMPFSAEASHEPLSAEFFYKNGVLTQEQYQLLCDGTSGWTGPGLQANQDPMSTWLGDKVMEHRVSYEKVGFKYEEDEADLEYEQLKEIEQERDFLEDDIEALKGEFFPLKETFIGLNGSNGEIKIGNLWDIPPGQRGSVYNTLRRRAAAEVLRLYREQVKQYNGVATERQIGKWEHDYAILKDAKLIGMTTTGLSKYRALVSALKPKIVMIEEAAETIEAPVTAACVESLQHLILVGDHKQLQGSCSVSDLEGDPFFLNVSMFERLVQNGVEFRSLTLQRRMAPEIRRLLTPIYDNLEDHESVNELAKVPAMGDVRSFFFCHRWPESSDSLFSKYNHNEAVMVATFFLYLVFAGTDTSNITVLTFYNGQRKKILKLLKENRHLQGKHIKVHTVDSYQGEENEIVLLSLVRSNGGHRIGFLAVENRVCVALSRARRGFFIFGNGEKLAAANPLWWQVVKIMGEGPVESRRIGYHLPLTCDNHGNKEFVRTPEDIIDLQGGCHVFCEATLECGHTCPLRCHVFDHSRIQCEATCGTTLGCGHTCGNKCSAETCRCATCGYWTKNTSFVRKSSQLAGPAPTSQEQGHLKPEIPVSYAEKLRKYQEFANGGVKDHDRVLAEALKAETAEDLLARLDAEAQANLFEGDEPGLPGIVPLIEDTASEKGDSTRKRWVHSYDPSKGLEKLTVNSPEMSLLDL